MLSLYTDIFDQILYLIKYLFYEHVLEKFYEFDLHFGFKQDEKSIELKNIGLLKMTS